MQQLLFRLQRKHVIVMKVPKENSVGTPLPGCPTAPPSIADTSGEVSLQEYLSLIVAGLPVIIARGAAPWQSRNFFAQVWWVFTSIYEIPRR